MVLIPLQAEVLHAVLCKATAVRFRRVERRLLLRSPAKDRHQLIIRSAVLRCNRRACLAQSMDRAAGKISVVALFAEAIPETILGEGASVVIDQPG